MSQYPALHFFLDESGKFTGRGGRRQVDLVGGVLLFGDYDAAADDRLRTILRDRLAEAGGVFPGDLHFSSSRLGDRMPEFLRAVSSDLRAWCGQERAIHGISLLYAADMTDAPGILAERQSDFRYLSMLWGLVEHLVFVDENVAQRLAPEAAVHLHVASRAYVFDPAVESKESMESLGYRVYEARHAPGKLAVPNILRETDLLTMLRMALRQRWQDWPLRLAEIKVRSMDYDRDQIPAALYLADLHLGLVREEERAARQRVKRKRKAELLPSFRKLRYGPWLDVIARMQAALRSGDAEAYLKVAETLDASAADPAALEPVLKRQQQAAVALLARSPERILAVLEDACRVVDAPGRVAEGWRRAERASRLLGHFPERNLRAEALALQARLSYANHIAKADAAEETWRQYLAIEPELTALGFEGLRLRAEMRNRRAVSLTDRFQYDEAEQTLAAVLADQQAIQALLEATAGDRGAPVPNRELGACHGTMGQVCSFLGTGPKLAQAEASFRQALACFSEPGDLQRQWIYLGHLACDRGPAGESLWKEVQEHLSKLAAARPITGSGQQYLLALQIKGNLVFAPRDALLQFLNQWQQCRPLEKYPREEIAWHPFGLIHQAIALAYVRAWRETGKAACAAHARESFAAAVEPMKTGGPLLQGLGYFAQLRQDLFELESQSASASQAKLVKDYLILRGHLAASFGAAAWSEDPSGRADGFFGRRDPGPEFPLDQRVARVIEGIRFNYW